MSSTGINKIAVIGTGVIGSSWIALFLAHGLEVFVADPADGAEQKLQAYLDFIWPQIQHKSADADRTRLLHFAGPEIPASVLASVDLVQENGPERLPLKIGLLAALDAATRPDVPICSSTSTLLPSKLVTGCGKAPERVLVAHPWNPPHLLPLVELVPHPGTAESVLGRAREFYAAVGKKPIVLRREAPGFVGNRLQAAVAREAANLVADGVCDPEDVEIAMVDALGPRWALTGPFMTSTLGGGGNPGGYRQMQERLGPAFADVFVDMDRVTAKLAADRLTHARGVIAKVDERIGQVDTIQLQREWNEGLSEIFKLREEKKLLNSYADRE